MPSFCTNERIAYSLVVVPLLSALTTLLVSVATQRKNASTLLLFHNNSNTPGTVKTSTHPLIPTSPTPLPIFYHTLPLRSRSARRRRPLPHRLSPLRNPLTTRALRRADQFSVTGKSADPWTEFKSRKHIPKKALTERGTDNIPHGGRTIENKRVVFSVENHSWSPRG